MTPTSQASSRDIVIHAGHAYLQMIASAHILLEREPFWTECLLLRLVRTLYTHRLRRLLNLLPDDMVTEILAGYEDSEAFIPFSSS